MEAWASYYTPEQNIRFLCVCVESQGVAKMFASMFGFENAVNAYIPSMQYMPRGYGQLGCSGFVIADQQGNFIARKTKRYLDYGEEAFRHVEAILQQELKALTLSTARKTAKGEPVTATIMEGRDGNAKRVKRSVREGEQKKALSLEERLNSFLDNHGTGIDMVDHEHEECITALQRLLKSPAAEELEFAIDILKAHFQSEENMMTTHGFGGDENSSFSALGSHVSDHEKILKLGMVELRRVQAMAACGD